MNFEQRYKRNANRLWRQALKDIRARFNEEPDLYRLVANQHVDFFDRTFPNGDRIWVETDENGVAWACREDGNGDVVSRREV